ncbi:interleukin-17F-like [Alosa sapidissima]|uniref:interleukin-17F-like n=1 Tax=Alosa sapidissima TaxID=34773 RepID=UPI001C08A187|nr:interleukin-17F-like [Alosa sapidissima]
MATTQGPHTSQIFKTVLVLALAHMLLVDGVYAEKIRLTVNNAPPRQSYQISKSLNDRSLSPWESITTSDINRIPKFISEVRCLKQGCIWPNGSEDQGLASVPIQLEVLVLKRSGRGQRKGKRRSSTILYQPSYQVITVGCTCVRPIVTEMTD